MGTIWGYSSVGLEHLPYKQGVVGSNPTIPTKRKPIQFTGWAFLLCATFISSIQLLWTSTTTVILAIRLTNASEGIYQSIKGLLAVNQIGS
jgi:hypothetical protein